MAKTAEKKNEETEAAKSASAGAEDKKETGKEIAKETMTGDLRDAILQFVKELQKPWQQLGELEQRSLVDKIEKRVGGLVDECVQIISAEGRKVMIGKLESLAVKDGIKAVVKISSADDLRHEAMDSVGKHVLLVVTDKTEFTGQKAPAEVQPDQRHLLPDDDGPVADNARNIPK